MLRNSVSSILNSLAARSSGLKVAISFRYIACHTCSKKWCVRAKLEHFSSDVSVSDLNPEA